jgi:hypothetical protein
MRPAKEELIQYNAFYRPDTDYSAYARLLQSKWREKNGFKMGKLGNYLESDFAKTSKANFLTDAIKQLVSKAIVDVRKEKGLIGEPRIWNNLLSSQPLCFNLFGELHYDMVMATQYFCQLFPDRIDKVTSITFEHSPGRRNTKYLGDNSAFDVFVEYEYDNKRGFIGIEVKYAESLKEETLDKAAKNYKERYKELTDQSNLFKQDTLENLKMPPLSQIWRDHLLSIATKQDYDDGFFVFLFPSENKECQNGVDSYLLNLKTNDEKINGFYPRHVDDFILELQKMYDTEWVKELRERYVG